MSPILVRPVREQLEHDRIIRLLHGKARRKHDAGMNPGAERNAGVGVGPATVFPDLVLHTQDRARKLEAIVEVETGESVNHLEALAEWVHYSRQKVAFHLYVPSNMVDVARQLCEENHIVVHEFWSYHSIGDDVRFALIHKSKDVPPPLAVPLPKKVAEVKPPAKVEPPRKPAPTPVAAKRPAAKSTAKAPTKTAAKAPAKAPAKVASKVAAKAASKRVAPKRAAAPVKAAKRKAAPARPVKAAPRRKAAPVKKKAARPAKRK